MLSLPLSLVLLAGCGLTASVPDLISNISSNQRELFDITMGFFDKDFNATEPILFDSRRYSSWYAVSLLARNNGTDADEANKLIQNVISHQYTDTTKIWFGTFSNKIDMPDPSTVANPIPYTDYDPNVRDFIGTAWIIALEEFSGLLPNATVKLIEESLYNATVGDGYRVGGWDNDNLYPSYSNPWLMRSIQTTYAGKRLNDVNMTYWGNIFAQEAVDHFYQYDTLGEFNSPTYMGVSLYALTLWNRYGPEGSVVKKHGADLISGVWSSAAKLYNPTLKNLGGAWDRSYGFDMNQYLAIFGFQIAGIVGLENAPLPSPLYNCLHYSDAAIVPLLAIISGSHDPHVPNWAKTALMNFSGSHQWDGESQSPPLDSEGKDGARKYSAWLEDGLSLGAVAFKEKSIGGPALNTIQFNPTVLQWRTANGFIGWFNLVSTEGYVDAVVNKRQLTVTYPAPNLTQSSPTIFSFILGPTSEGNVTFSDAEMSFGDLVLSISGNVFQSGVDPIVTYNSFANINGFPYVNVTWVLPANITQPSIQFQVKKF